MQGMLKVKHVTESAAGRVYVFEEPTGVVVILSRRPPVTANGKASWLMVMIVVVTPDDSAEPHLERLIRRAKRLVLPHIVLRRQKVQIVETVVGVPAGMVPLRIEMVEARLPFDCRTN